MTKITVDFNGNYDSLLELLSRTNSVDLKSYLYTNFNVDGGFSHEKGRVEYRVPDTNFRACRELIESIGGTITILPGY